MIFKLLRIRNRIIFISSLNDRILTATYEKKGDVFHIGPISEVERSENLTCASCHILLHSPQASIIQDYFPMARSEALKMILDERIREEGYLSADATFSHAFKVTGHAKGKQQLLVVSLPSVLVDRALETAETLKVKRLQGITSVPAALAVLAGKISEQPVLSVIIRNGSCEFLICHQGLPILLQASPAENDSPEFSATLMQSMKAVVQRAERSHGLRVNRVLFLGQGVDYSAVVEQGFQVLKPDFSRFVTAENPADLSRFPEFAGALLQGGRMDYLPRSWRMAYRLQDVTCFTAMGAAVAGIVLLSISVNMQKELKHYRGLYQRQMQQVTDYSMRLKAMLPPEKEVQHLETIMDYWEKSADEPRIGDILTRIANALPQDIRIERFDAHRSHASQQHQNQGKLHPPASAVPGSDAPGPPQQTASLHNTRLPDSPVTFEMNLVTSGNFTEARSRFEQTVKRLGKWFELSDINWKYHENSNTGTMECKFQTKRLKGGS